MSLRRFGIAAFEALTRLPLAPSDWREVASFTTRVQISGDSDAERIAVRDASPWVLAKDHPPAVAEWMGGAEPPGFIDLSPGERAEVEGCLGDAGCEQSLWELLDPQVGPEQGREQAVAVTLLFEEVLRGGREHVTNFLDGNNIVLAIHALQGRFRPDLAGLSLLYQRVAKELLGEGAEPGLFRFVEIEATGGPRSFCYHLGWTVSRGGLHGLVPRLAAQLASEDRDERMAAAYLIADAAAFFSHSLPLLFGGSAAPSRPPISDPLVEDVAHEPTRSWPPATEPIEDVAHEQQQQQQQQQQQNSSSSSSRHTSRRAACPRRRSHQASPTRPGHSRSRAGSTP